MEKLYPENGKKALLDMQLRRYRYLEQKVAQSIIRHEKQDYLPTYRMDERSTLDTLRQTGFKNIKIVDRLERDVVLVARK